MNIVKPVQTFFKETAPNFVKQVPKKAKNINEAHPAIFPLVTGVIGGGAGIAGSNIVAHEKQGKMLDKAI